MKLYNLLHDLEICLALLHDSLHLQQYVERVSKVIQFMISQNVFLNEELSTLWKAKSGAHPAIVSNIHDLIADNAFDLGEPQVEHLFHLVLVTWSNSDTTNKDREIMLTLVSRLGMCSYCAMIKFGFDN